MKLSTREKTLLVILAVMICAVAFYLLWYAPKTAKIAELRQRVEQKTQDVEDASSREIAYALLSKSKEENAESWEKLLEEIPESFDEADVLKRIHRIITPYTTDIIVEFAELSATEGQTEAYPVDIGFTVAYSDLQSILGALEKEDTLVRIINSACELMNYTGGEPVLEVNMTAEFFVLK